MTDRLYHHDPYLLDFEATVVAHRRHEKGPAVVLDRTAFYAESGGQPWDTGLLEWSQVAPQRARVAAVIEDGDEVLHVLEDPGGEAGPPPGQRVVGHVDGARRADHRQQHHGQHLLSRALLEVTGARTVSVHLGAEQCSIDLDREITEAALSQAARRANEIVWAGRAVSVRSLSRSQAQALGVVVPAEAGDRVRLVEAEGFDLQPCGGTHPARTSEVGLVLPLGQERYKGGSRVRFVCGQRALSLAESNLRLLRDAGGLLSSAPESVPAGVAKLHDQAAQAERRCRGLEERLVEAEAGRLLERLRADPAASANTLVITAILEGWEAPALRQLAARLTDATPCVALLASRTDKAQLVFARSETLPHDVGRLLQMALQPLGGRGGGRGRVAQGGSDRLHGLEAAMERAAAQARSQDSASGAP